MHLYLRFLITLFRKIIYAVKGPSFGENAFQKVIKNMSEWAPQISYIKIQ